MMNGYAHRSKSCQATSAELVATVNTECTSEVLVMKIGIDANIGRKMNEGNSSIRC